MYIKPWTWFALVICIIVLNAMLWIKPVLPCDSKWCQNPIVGGKRAHPITNMHRQRVGDIYDPDHGRLQIRNNSR